MFIVFLGIVLASAGAFNHYDKAHPGKLQKSEWLECRESKLQCDLDAVGGDGGSGE